MTFKLIVSLIHLSLFQIAYSDVLIQKVKENEPIMKLISLNETQYFEFDLSTTKNVNTITFRVSSPNLLYLISTKCQYVNNECSEFFGTSENPVILQKNGYPKFKKAIYHISITALETVKQTFTVEVTYKDEVHVQEIKKGKKYQSQLSIALPVTCFSYSQSTASNFSVNLHGPSAKLVMYGNSQKNQDSSEINQPTEEEHEQISYSNYMFFDTIISLEVCVEAIETSFTPQPYYADQRWDHYNYTWMNQSQYLIHFYLFFYQSYTQIHFSILIFDPKTYLTLELNDPTFGTINPWEKHLYSLMFDVETEDIFITKQIISNAAGQAFFSNDIQFYLGDSPYVNIEDYEFDFSKHHSSTAMIDTNLEDFLCKEKKRILSEKLEEKTYCEIFILVVSNSQQRERYQLTAYKKQLSIQLVEGHQSTYNLEHIVNSSDIPWMHFYFKPTIKSAPITVFAQSYYGKISLTLNMWTNDDRIHKSQWPFPTNTEISTNSIRTGDWSSYNQNSLHRSILPSALEQCWPDCILLISIQHIDDINYSEIMQNKESIQVNYDDTFTLMCSQTFSEIQENQKIQFSLNHGDYRYLVFRNLKKLFNSDENERLVLNLMPFIGSGYMTVTVNDPSNQRTPHQRDQLDWSSKGTYLELTKEQVLTTIGLHKLDQSNSYLIIEVGAEQIVFQDSIQNGISKLEFSATYIDQDIPQLEHSVPHALLVRPHSKSTLQFFNYYYQDLKIKVFRNSGFGILKIWLCQPPTNIFTCLEDGDKENFKPIQQIQLAGQEASQIHLRRDQKDEKFCVFCSYLIQIEADDQELNALVTVQTQNDYVNLVKGIAFSDYSMKDDSNYYEGYYNKNDQIEVILQVQQGDPQLYIDFDRKLNLTNFKIGPLNLNQYKEQNKLDQDFNNFRMIIPPRVELKNSTFSYLQDISKTKNEQSEDENENQYSNLKIQTYFILDQFYMVVNCPDKGCNYTISYFTGSIDAQIRDGLMNPVHLSNYQRSVVLSYEHYDPDVKPVLEIISLNHSNLDSMNFSCMYIMKQAKDDYTFKSQTPLRLNLISSTQNIKTYQIPVDFGLYKFIFNNSINLTKEINYNFDSNSVNELNFEVLVNARDIIVSPFNKSTTGYLEQSSINYYETIVPQKGIIIVEINSCIGDIQFGYSQNYQDFLNESYTDTITIQKGTYQVQHYPVNKGVFFHSIHSGQNSESYFKIQTHYFKTLKENPFGKLIAGDGGQIFWDYKPGHLDKLFLHFDSVKCPSCKKSIIKKTKIDYQVFWSTQLNDLNMFGHCDSLEFYERKVDDKFFRKTPFQTYQMTVFEDESEEKPLEFELSLEGLEYYTSIFVGIRAVTQNFQGSPYQIQVNYNTIEVPVPNSLAKLMSKNRALFGLIVVGLIVIIILLTICLCLYARRYRKTKASLDFEIQDRKMTELSKRSKDSSQLPVTYENLNED